MNSTRPPQAGKGSSYVRIAVSFIFGFIGYLMPEKVDATLRIVVAYVGWSWFWGLVLLYPAYIQRVQSERSSLVRAYSFFHWGAFYICQSMLFGILGGGIYRFIKELLSLRERRATQEHKN